LQPRPEFDPASVALAVAPSIDRLLMPFQRECVAYCVARGGRALISLDMGCGKTITSLAAASHFAAAWPLLVVCPSSLKHMWRQAITDFLPHLEGRVCIIATGKDHIPVPLPGHAAESCAGRTKKGKAKGAAAAATSGVGPEGQADAAGAKAAKPKSRKKKGTAAAAAGDEVNPVAVSSEAEATPVPDSAPAATAQVVIVSYDLIPPLVKAGKLVPRMFRIVIADESHNLKGRDTQRTKAVLPLLQKATHTLLLSGTPALNRPCELYTQIAAIRPALFPTYTAFAIRYCGGRTMSWGFDDQGASNLDELRSILEIHCMYRKLKQDVLRLPPKQRAVLRVGITQAAAQAIAALEREQAEIRVRRRNCVRADERAMLEYKEQAVLMKIMEQTGVGKVPGVVNRVLSLLRPFRSTDKASAAEEEAGAEEKAKFAQGGSKRARSSSALASADVEIISDGDDCEHSSTAQATKVAIPLAKKRKLHRLHSDDSESEPEKAASSPSSGVASSVSSIPSGGFLVEDDGTDSDETVIHMGRLAAATVAAAAAPGPVATMIDMQRSPGSPGRPVHSGRDWRTTLDQAIDTRALGARGMAIDSMIKSASPSKWKAADESQNASQISTGETNKVKHHISNERSRAQEQINVELPGAGAGAAKARTRKLVIFAHHRQ
jgi:hypothetical protein